MRKRAVSLLLIFTCGLLSGCTLIGKGINKQYTATYYTLFDTVTIVTGFASSENEFQEVAEQIYDELYYYHKLFDIYHDYEDVANLKTVNDNAGISPVLVAPEIIQLLEDCIHYYHITNGVVNIAMGSVLRVWHTAREDGLKDPTSAYVPEISLLQEKAQHSDIGELMVDRDQQMVYIKDSEMSLDVGSVAKGWSVQRVSENIPEGYLISVGGNVCITGPKDQQGSPWVIGIENPDGGDYLQKISIGRGSVVTSGDYQRGFQVNGKYYHHLIDPASLYPATLWRSVSVICADSGLADVLSTALFLLPKEEGEILLRNCDAHAMWVNTSGEIFYSEGFISYIK